MFPIFSQKPASVAQLDARLTGDQEVEVAGSIPARLAKFFRGDLTMKYFLLSFLSADSRRAVVSFWQKNVPLRGLSLPSKSVVR